MFAAVPKVRTVLVLVFKTGGRNRIFVPVYGSSSFPFTPPIVSPLAVLQSCQLGRWNSEYSGDCWFLLCRGGLLVLVFYTTNLSALRACCIPCTISAFCSLVPQHLAVYAPFPVHLNIHQYICCGEMTERSHRSQCISSSDALSQTQQSKDFCNLFLGNVPVYQEWLFSLKLPVTAWVPLSPQGPCKAQSQGGRAHSSQWPTVLTATSRSPRIATI